MAEKKPMFSKTCEYGIRAAIYVAKESMEERRSGMKEIAKQIDSPLAFTAKILQTLVRARIISSYKGPNGGFIIEKGELGKIDLKQVVLAIDGDYIFEDCGLGLSKCNAKKPCPMHDQFVAIRSQLDDMLISTKLKDLTEGLESGLTFLNK